MCLIVSLNRLVCKFFEFDNCKSAIYLSACCQRTLDVWFVCGNIVVVLFESHAVTRVLCQRNLWNEIVVDIWYMSGVRYCLWLISVISFGMNVTQSHLCSAKADIMSALDFEFDNCKSAIDLSACRQRTFDIMCFVGSRSSFRLRIWPSLCSL